MKELPQFSGDHELVAPLNRMVDCIKERTPLKGKECEIDQFPHGFRPKPKPPGASASGSCEQFRLISVHKDHLLAQRITFTTTIGDPIVGAEINTIVETVTESIDSEIVQIAKPHSLRATPFHTRSIDGLLYEYDQNGPNVDQQQNPWNYREVTIESVPTVSGSIPSNYSEPYPVGTVLMETIWPRYIPGVTLIYASKVKQKPVVRHPTFLLDSDPAVINSEDVNCEWVDLNADGRKWEMLWRRIRVCIEGGASQYVLVRTSQPYTA